MSGNTSAAGFMAFDFTAPFNLPVLGSLMQKGEMNKQLTAQQTCFALLFCALLSNKCNGFLKRAKEIRVSKEKLRE